MKDFILEMFKENGSISSTRVITVLIVCVALVIAIYGAVTSKPINELVSLLLGISISGKVIQKFAEIKKVD